MRRVVLLAVVALLCAALPAAAPAARKACAKRASCAAKACAKRAGCKGRAGGRQRGLPVRWTRFAPLPGTGGPPAPGAARPGGRTTGPGGDGPPPPPPPPPPADDPRFVQVTSGDSDPEALTLTLSRTTLLAGTVGVEFNNKYAEDPHDLRIRRGTTVYAFDEVAAGAAATKHVDLAPGTWRLWCNLANHEQRGMVAEVTVVAG